MDSDYYSKLLTNQSRPFYNNATQEKTAPGSTYKPISAITGLTEGVIDVNTYLPCAGVFRGDGRVHRRGSQGHEHHRG